MLRNLTILNPAESRNQRIILPDMDNIGIGSPNTIWELNLMECTCTIQPTSMKIGTKKNIGREKPTKSSGPIEQVMVKTELENVEVGKASLCTHRYSQHCALILEKHQCTIQPFKQRGQYEAHPRKWHQMIYYFFPTFAPLPHGTKSNRLNKTYISTKRYSISKVNSSPIWRNTLGHILMNTIAYYPVYFRMLTNNISSNPITHMVVTFYWFLYIDKKIFNICRLLDEIFRD